MTNVNYWLMKSTPV